MEKTTDFHKFATECVRLAESARTIEDKALLLSMAEVWIELADNAESIQALLERDSPV
jgi:hypothetical protein